MHGNATIDRIFVGEKFENDARNARRKIPVPTFPFLQLRGKILSAENGGGGLAFEMASAFAHGAASPVSGPAALLARRPVPSGAHA